MNVIEISHTLQKWLSGKNAENAAYYYNPSLDNKSDAPCTLGPMSSTCEFCSTMKFKGETPDLCCSGGKKNIRRYNSCFQRTSFGSSKQVIETGYMPTFKVQGQVYHIIGSIFPFPVEEPKFLQIYFIDGNTEQAELCCKIVQQVKQDLVLKFQDMLQRNNSYIKSCITTQIMHGPCRVINSFSPCIKDGRCTKRYPRECFKENQTGKDGYPLYRHRKPENRGFSTVINV
ncbi:ATP-dependent DNA helicase PIF1 [Trichonephila clavipes]|nr:ATP-dependent DNA helicase PIF1 [Trichonephila clavipes]